MSNYGRARPYVSRSTPQQYRDRQAAIKQLHQLQFDEWIFRRSPKRYSSSYQKLPKSLDQIRRDQIESRVQAKAYRIQQEDLARERARQVYLENQACSCYKSIPSSQPYYRRDDPDGWMHFSDTELPNSRKIYPGFTQSRLQALQRLKRFKLTQPFVLARIQVNRLKAQAKLKAKRLYYQTMQRTRELYKKRKQ